MTFGENRERGHAADVSKLLPDAHPHQPVVGRHADLALTPAYREALPILRRAPTTEVTEEDEADAIVAQLASEMAAHDAGWDDAKPALAAADATGS